MVTNRTPVGRTPLVRITAEAVEQFKKIRKLEDEADINTWEDEGGTKRQWYDLCGTLHRLLGRTPGDYDITECRDSVPHSTVAHDDDYRATHALYLELERLAGTPKRTI